MRFFLQLFFFLLKLFICFYGKKNITFSNKVGWAEIKHCAQHRLFRHAVNEPDRQEGDENKRWNQKLRSFSFSFDTHLSWRHFSGAGKRLLPQSAEECRNLRLWHAVSPAKMSQNSRLEEPGSAGEKYSNATENQLCRPISAPSDWYKSTAPRPAIPNWTSAQCWGEVGVLLKSQGASSSSSAPLPGAETPLRRTRLRFTSSIVTTVFVGSPGVTNTSELKITYPKS